MKTLSIVILTFNRAKELLMTLKAVTAQKLDVPPQIIVVDNGSTDETSKVLSAFPGIEVISLRRNEGAVARNHGLLRARGDFIVCLDDDVRPLGIEDFGMIVPFMESHPEIGAITFKVLTPMGVPELYSWCHPRDPSKDADKVFFSPYLSEGACALRREAIENVGGYWQDLFIAHEGEDLAFRLMDAGYELVYFPPVQVIHTHARAGRPSWRTFYYNHRNNLWVIWKNLPWMHALSASLYASAFMLFFSLRGRKIKAYLKACVDGLLGFRRVWEVRKPIEKETLARIRVYQSLKPNLLNRFRRHLTYRVF
jgi:GT2 family glycosyltransferase